MISKTTISIAALSLAAFLGGMIGSIYAKSQPDTPTSQPDAGDRPRWGRCLGLGDERIAQIESLDPDFSAELAELRTRIHDRRHQLADLFEASDSADDDIRTAVEAIIEARSALERRVTEYLLVVRHELTAQQQRRLFIICAEGLRGGPGGGWGWPHGRGGSSGWRGDGRGGGHGGGPGKGGGWGRGHGRDRDQVDKPQRGLD